MLNALFLLGRCLAHPMHLVNSKTKGYLTSTLNFTHDYNDAADFRLILATTERTKNNTVKTVCLVNKDEQILFYDGNDLYFKDFGLEDGYSIFYLPKDHQIYSLPDGTIMHKSINGENFKLQLKGKWLAEINGRLSVVDNEEDGDEFYAEEESDDDEDTSWDDDSDEKSKEKEKTDTTEIRPTIENEVDALEEQQKEIIDRLKDGIKCQQEINRITAEKQKVEEDYDNLKKKHEDEMEKKNEECSAEKKSVEDQKDEEIKKLQEEIALLKNKEDEKDKNSKPKEKNKSKSHKVKSSINHKAEPRSTESDSGTQCKNQFTTPHPNVLLQREMPRMNYWNPYVYPLSIQMPGTGMCMGGLPQCAPTPGFIPNPMSIEKAINSIQNHPIQTNYVESKHNQYTPQQYMFNGMPYNNIQQQPSLDNRESAPQPSKDIGSVIECMGFLVFVTDRKCPKIIISPLDHYRHRTSRSSRRRHHQ